MILWTHNDFLRRRMCYTQYEFIVVNYDFLISQGSVTTVFR